MNDIESQPDQETEGTVVEPSHSDEPRFKLPAWHYQLAAGVGLLVLVLAFRDGFHLGDELQSFQFQSPHQPSLLLLRCGVLYWSLSVLRDAPKRSFGIVALFLLSLAFRIALVPFLLVALASAFSARWKADRLALSALHGLLAMAILLSLHSLASASEMPDAKDPAKMASYWNAKKNPYAARYWAMRWMRTETTGAGDATLAMALLDWKLGRHEQARFLLQRAMQQPSSPEIKKRAELILFKWNKAERAQ